MDLRTTNPKSWSRAKYIIAVLWMEGRLSTSEIAKQVNMSGGQVRGFYTQEFLKAREHMAISERQAMLKFLKGWSGWFGVFIDSRFEDRFRAKELSSERRARLIVEDKAKPKEEQRELSKKELRAIAHEETNRLQREEADRLKREFGYAPRGPEVDALGWLYGNALGDRNETVAKGTMMSRDRRREALLKFRTHLAGMSISPLQAQDYEAVGGGGGQKLTLPEYRKFCIDNIGGIRGMLRPNLFSLVERIVEHDLFVWLGTPKGERRTQIYEAIRCAADTMAVFYQMMTRDDFEIRWKERLPISSVPSRAAARADSAMTQDIVDQLTKAVA